MNSVRLPPKSTKVLFFISTKQKPREGLVLLCGDGGNRIHVRE